MTTITLGNVSVLECTRDEDDVIVRTLRPDLGQQVFTMMFPESWTLLEMFKGVVDAWPFHSPQPPGWVDGDDEQLNGLVAAQWGCQIGQPKSWRPTPLEG